MIMLPKQSDICHTKKIFKNAISQHLMHININRMAYTLDDINVV